MDRRRFIGLLAGALLTARQGRDEAVKARVCFCQKFTRRTE